MRNSQKKNRVLGLVGANIGPIAEEDLCFLLFLVPFIFGLGWVAVTTVVVVVVTPPPKLGENKENNRAIYGLY